MGLEAVLFDLGETLVRYRAREDVAKRIFTHAVREGYGALNGGGRPALELVVRRLYRAIALRYFLSRATLREINVASIIDGTLRRLGIESETERGAFIRAAVEAVASRGHVVPGTVACLEGLKSDGLRLGVISNTVMPASFVESVLARIGVAGMIDAVVASSEHGWRKPCASIFREALARLDAAPAEAAMVGDSLGADIAGAERLGIATILIRSGRPQPFARVEPRAVVGDMAECLEAVRALKRTRDGEG